MRRRLDPCHNSWCSSRFRRHEAQRLPDGVAPLQQRLLRSHRPVGQLLVATEPENAAPCHRHDDGCGRHPPTQGQPTGGHGGRPVVERLLNAGPQLVADRFFLPFHPLAQPVCPIRLFHCPCVLMYSLIMWASIFLALEYCEAELFSLICSSRAISLCDRCSKT